MSDKPGGKGARRKGRERGEEGKMVGEERGKKEKSK